MKDSKTVRATHTIDGFDGYIYASDGALYRIGHTDAKGRTRTIIKVSYNEVRKGYWLSYTNESGQKKQAHFTIAKLKQLGMLTKILKPYKIEL